MGPNPSGPPFRKLLARAIGILRIFRGSVKRGSWNGDFLEYGNSVGVFSYSEFISKNGWLEYYFPIGETYFQGLC